MGALTGIVLAGGQSSRMGRDKAGLPWGDSTLLRTVLDRLAPVCAELIVVSNTPRPELDGLGVRLTADAFLGCGPLGGIHAGLTAASNPYSFVTACDMPFLNTDAVAHIAASAAGGFDAAVPWIDGYYHPLHAVYRVSCLPLIERMLAEGNYRVLDFYPAIRLRRVTEDEIARFDPALATLRNINTPEDLAACAGDREIDPNARTGQN